jgi:hypothetical protein
MALEFDTIIDGVDPGRVYIGGEIRAVWDILEPAMLAAPAVA